MAIWSLELRFPFGGGAVVVVAYSVEREIGICGVGVQRQSLGLGWILGTSVAAVEVVRLAVGVGGGERVR